MVQLATAVQFPTTMTKTISKFTESLSTGVLGPMFASNSFLSQSRATSAPTTKKMGRATTVLRFVLVALSIPVAGYPASFDCTKAASYVEKAVCSDAELSKLDDDLNAAYLAASAEPKTAKQVRRDQRQWVANRNGCRDRACIKTAYTKRLQEFPAASDESRAANSTNRATPGEKFVPQAPVHDTSAIDVHNGGVQAIRSLEFKHFGGRLRVDDGRVIFSHYDQSGNAHNVVALDPADGSARNLVEGVPEAKFIAEDKRYLVYSSRGVNANPLIVYDKRSGTRVAPVRLRSDIQWGHIDGDRLILLQSGSSHNAKATVLVYRLPHLKLERTAEITGGNETALWKDRIVSIGYRLGIYDLDLREISLVDMPPRDTSSRNNCGGGPLRISGDKAVVGANCGQLAVVDLPSARIERVISTNSLFQSFDIADGLIFTVDPDGKQPDVRVIELSSGRELARLAIDTNFVAMRGRHLLGMKRKDFATPVQFTLYKVDFSSIRSETSRVARVESGCRVAEQSLNRDGDLHAAADGCEKAGIRGFSNSNEPISALADIVEKYALWLTRTLSRYNEGVEILERLNSQTPSAKFESHVGWGRQKAFYLDPPLKDARPVQGPLPRGVERVTLDFGAFSNLIHFEGDRIYIARWSCGATGDAGVTLDILERNTFQVVKRIVVANCDDDQQDSITAIGVVTGFIVLGMEYRYPEEGRSTVVVVNAHSLEVEREGVIPQDIAQLRQWNDRLLACAEANGQPSHRFDPTSARLVAASEDEARACTNGDPTELTGRRATSLSNAPVATTLNYRVYGLPGRPLTSYRISDKRNTNTLSVNVKPRQYMDALAVSDRDALVLRYTNGELQRFARFDIATQSEAGLFELNPANRPLAAVVWRNFLFVSLGRDLLVYDLERRVVLGYEKDLIREGFLNNCCGVDRNGITRLLLDGERLIALTFDGSNTRIVHLPNYVASLPRTDFFMALRANL